MALSSDMVDHISIDVSLLIQGEKFDLYQHICTDYEIDHDPVTLTHDDNHSTLWSSLKGSWSWLGSSA